MMNEFKSPIKRNEVEVDLCQNEEADDIFLTNYWLKRIRRSRRISYSVSIFGKKVAWVQCADPFGTKLAKPLQIFDINEAVELCRGYFLDNTPSNLESCGISFVLRRLPNDWYSNFNVRKKVAIIYQDIDAGQKGLVYQALGFHPYSTCSRARHYTEPSRGNSHGSKVIWARALRPISGHHYKICLPISTMVM